ncbi:MAG: mandelate racemase/muconate lactonizing enzyme family protein [Bryobacteraceae bacterium]|nr:mandelate racemase/muconate lactonizing enzyme family protein [Bryobacteraceae bacterium]
MKTTRRALLPLLAAPALRAASPRESGRIAKLETFFVRVNHRGGWQIARITTAGGLTGIGDASHGQKDEAVLALMRTFFDRLKTMTVWDLERFRSDVWPDVAKAGRNGAVAFGALEQCCWDLRGKITGLPVYDLLGGKVRDTVRCYANINRSSEVREPEAFAGLAARAVAAGFDAVKLAPFDGMPRNDAAKIKVHTDRGVACVAAVRRAVGDKADVLIDGHSNFDLPASMELMRRLEPLRLYWLEEVTRAPEDLAKVNEAASMTTAGGESIFGVDGFYPYIRAGAVDIVMPDVKYCGGIWEMKKIGAMAEAAKLKVSPHGPASPVGNIAAAHVCLTMPNFTVLEMAFGEVPWRHQVVTPPEQFVKGHLTPSARPGFGLELNDAFLRERAAAEPSRAAD